MTAIPNATAEIRATRALAERGITAHRDHDAGNTWLVIARDQAHRGVPDLPTKPYAVLYLHNESSDDGGEEISVTRAPMTGDHWRVLTSDGTGPERELVTLPADQLTACIDAITAWMTTPQEVLARPARQSTVSHRERALEGLPADWQRAARRVID